MVTGRPNIILITLEGMGWQDLGAAGNGVIRTPNLDGLASHGLRFTQATTTTPMHRVERVPTDGLPSQVGVLVDTLRAHSYAIGAVGTALLDAVECDLHAFAGVEGQPDTYLMEQVGNGQPPETLEESHHVTTWSGSQAVRFCQGAEEPFFLNVGFDTAVAPPEPWRSMHSPRQMVLQGEAESPTERAARRQRLARHYGAVALLDRQIGRMMATLTARGRTNNVIIVAGTRGFDGAEPERDQPPLSEARVRVPLLVGGLLGQRRGEQDPALVHTGDVVATLLEAFSMVSPLGLEGRSFLEQVHQRRRPHRKAVVIHGKQGLIAVRTARYKWITAGPQQGEWLFDLQNDPFERQNLVHTRQAIPIRKMLTGFV